MLLLQRFEEELDIHQSLSADGTRHPNVLYMDSWFQDESYYYLILEICPHQVRYDNPKGFFWCDEAGMLTPSGLLIMHAHRLCWNCSMRGEP